jgi:hypothetical protein
MAVTPHSPPAHDAAANRQFPESSPVQPLPALDLDPPQPTSTLAASFFRLEPQSPICSSVSAIFQAQFDRAVPLLSSDTCSRPPLPSSNLVRLSQDSTAVPDLRNATFSSSSHTLITDNLRLISYSSSIPLRQHHRTPCRNPLRLSAARLRPDKAPTRSHRRPYPSQACCTLSPRVLNVARSSRSPALSARYAPVIRNVLY